MDPKALDTINVLAEDALLLAVLGLAAWKLTPDAWVDLVGVLLIAARTGVKMGALDKLMTRRIE